MSVITILDEVVTHLTTQMSLQADQIGVEPELTPPHIAPEFYIAVDEGDVVSDSTDNFLREKIGFEVGIWKRTGDYDKDRRAKIYSKSATGLDALERLVVINLHMSWALRAAINTAGSYGQAGNGDVYQLPPVYQGRGKTEARSIGTDNSGNLSTWLMRRLRFGGMLRVQEISVAK